VRPAYHGEDRTVEPLYLVVCRQIIFVLAGFRAEGDDIGPEGKDIFLELAVGQD